MGNNIRLDGKITLLSPMSHIGESLGIDSYLSTDQIIGPNGQPMEVFVYSGNAFRGILRDCSAIYMLDKLGGIQVPLSVFYLLMSGGSLGGAQSVDIDQARMYRRNIPMLSIFGGGVGNQILTGKINIGSMYPMVSECQRVLPESMRQENAPSWKKWTFEKSFTRMDDAKNENRRQYLAIPAEEIALLTGAEPNKKNKDEPAQQMRYTVEMLAAGAMLYQRIDLKDMSDLELGAFVAALIEFAKNPYIGGKQGTGHGLVDIEYNWRKLGEKNQTGKFLSLGTDCLWLSDQAEKAKQVYDDFLVTLYEQYLANNAPELTELLTAAAK